ncbi:MAG: integrase core domain-containing protein [Rhodospirillaceae bacterium]|nr:MAG: integrase core domain-containing protein [Rhodospirillaceae bacterium]
MRRDGCFLQARVTTKRILPSPEEKSELLRLGAECDHNVAESVTPTDTKFSGPFNEVWKSEGARVIQIPHGAPQVNAFCESFIGTFKRECLDFFVCFSNSQLSFILKSWIRHYNTERPHSGDGIGNNVLQVSLRPQDIGVICSREALGGIVRSSYREAA